ncbi:MAG: PorP/SprF family type IX secretion system membrane protein [Flavobacteriales bacterium]|nr:PorP/SprF family type IX secretion system membrane protein [Flavobacteriales bacterium]
MTRKLKHLLGIAALSIVLASSANAQDVHFSQFYETPLFMNPSNAGFFNGDIRAIVNYRNQWASIGNPYTTSMFSVDGRIFKNKINKVLLGAGLTVFTDKAGKSEFGTTQVLGALTAIVKLSDKHKLSAGFNGGFAQKGIKNSDLQWGNQYDNTSGTFNSSFDPNEGNALLTENTSYADFGGGISWSFNTRPSNMTANDRISADFGIELFHLNQPNQKFYLNNVETLHSKLVIHGKTYIGIKNTTLAIIPTFLMYQQKSLQEIIVGSMLRYTLSEESKYTGFIKESAVLVGGHYRLGDAFISSIYFEVSSFSVGISYDFTLSDLATSAGSTGGIEISLRFINSNPFKNKSGGSMY